MTVRHSPNTPVSDYKLQALLYHHWLVFCNQFGNVQATGVWPTLLSGTDGIIDTGFDFFNNPLASSFQTTSATFDGSHVGMYLAVRDDSNPVNTTIAKIIQVDSSTKVKLNSPVTVFSADATGVRFRIIDPTNLPGIGDHFVVQNPVTSNQPRWQARFSIESTVTGIQFAPIGGWRASDFSWTLPVCTQVLMPSTMIQSFMLADPDAGWCFLWTEETGGPSSNRNGVWMGSLSAFHSPRVLGAPSDESFAAIFGNVSGSAAAFQRNNNSTSSISVGETMNHDNTIVNIYWAQKRLLNSVTDTMSISAATPNPRSSESDDYDVIAFQRAPNQAFRGRVPGIRMLSDSHGNRTTLNNKNTYVIDAGIGVVWNGKDAVTGDV